MAHLVMITTAGGAAGQNSEVCGIDTFVMSCQVGCDDLRVGMIRQASLPLLKGPEDLYLGFCTLGIFLVCTGNIVPPLNQAI